MPPQLTYPGVYIQERPSGVRTIAGVATSITAFVGWAPEGPTDRAMRISSFADYQRAYGGLHPQSDLGYSVKHFFENGGGQAYILRIVKDGGTLGKTTLGQIQIEASSPGPWSQFYGVQTEQLGTTSRFSLKVVRFGKKTDGTADTSQINVVETYVNLSMDAADPRFVREVINDIETGSTYIKLTLPSGATDFGAGAVKPLSKGTDTPMAPEVGNDFKTALDKVVGPEKTLDKIDLFNLLCVPGLTDPAKLSVLEQFCEFRRAFLIADCDENARVDQLENGIPNPLIGKNGGYFFPWIKSSDALAENRLADFPPCGYVAGVIARTDASRGIWKAPAGLDASLVGIYSPKETLTDDQNGRLNIQGINCIRTFSGSGTVVWGARTLNGSDQRGDEWKYIPVRRTALHIEESLYRGTQWAVFEPNDEPLWAQLRLNVGTFMHDLFRQGAFQGSTPRDAYFVQCDKNTTTQSDINRGVVNVVVGFAPLKPAEFVVITLTQMAGQLGT